MKVLQINYGDYGGGGGGAIAMHCLHTGLNRLNAESKILSCIKTLSSRDSSKIQRRYRIESGLKKL